MRRRLAPSLSTAGLPLALLALGAFAAGCAGGGSSAPTDEDTADGDEAVDGDTEEQRETNEQLDDLIARGVHLIEIGQANEARPVFAEALAVDPNDPRAHFGAGFADAVTSYEQLFALIAVLKGGGGFFKDLSGQTYEDLSDFFGKLVPKVLGDATKAFERAIDHYTIVKQHADFALRFERIPVYMAVDEMSWMRGTVDLADVHMFDAEARTLLGLTRFVRSIDLHGDLALLFLSAKGQVESGGGIDTGGIMGTMIDILNRSERFLGIQPDGGAQFLAEMATLLGGAFDDVVEASRIAEEDWRTGTSTDPEQLFYLEVRRDRRLKAHIFRIDPNSGEEYAADPIILFQDDLPIVVKFRDNLLQGNGAPLALVSEVLPIVGSVVALAGGYGLLDYVGLELGINLDPKSIASLAKQFVPDAFAVDLGHYLHHPKGLRTMLPAWTTDRPEGQNEFIMEYECVNELDDSGKPGGTGGLLCAGPATASVDAAHFAGTPWEIPADGVQGRGPYVAFQDPTFGGMLYINPTKLDLPGENRFALATQQTLNAALQKVMDKVIDQFGKGGEGEGDGDTDVADGDEEAATDGDEEAATDGDAEEAAADGDADETATEDEAATEE